MPLAVEVESCLAYNGPKQIQKHALIERRYEGFPATTYQLRAGIYTDGGVGCDSGNSAFDGDITAVAQ